MSDARIALVGAGGQVGRYLMEYLAGPGDARPLGVCRNPLTASALRVAGFEVRIGPISDATEAEELLEGCDVVVNLAFASGLTERRARAEDRALLDGLVSLPGRRRLIHFSSVGVYGTCPDRRRNTFERPRPDWAYGRRKLEAERHLARVVASTRHEAVVVRLGHVYGVGQWLSRVILDSRDGRRLPFDGRHASNAIHVRNVAAAVADLVREWPGAATYNLVDAPASTWREVFDWHARALGLAPAPAMGEGESSRWALRLREEAGTARWRRLAGEVAAWGRGLPDHFFASCPSARAIGADLLDTLGLDRQRGRAQMRMQMLRHGRLVDRPSPAPEAWLLGEEVPGPRLAYRGERREGDAHAVAEWYEGLGRPDAIRQLVGPAPTPVARAIR